MTELLLQTDLTQEQHEYTTMAQDSGQALLKLIDDILDISKIEAGKVTLEKSLVNLRELIDGVLRVVGVQANAKGLCVQSRVDASVPAFVFGDFHRLRQVLTNLSNNAIKFTESGHVTIIVATESEGGSYANVRFSVIDSGIGLRPDQIAKLFLPFTQVDSSTTRKYGGTGLGLAICKHLIEMMGGTIGVESQEGLGSTFWFAVCLPTQA
jgi:two-component system sensor histidine kinase/response regulator